MAKKYNAVTGVDEFYYGVLNADESGIDGEAPERIKFLQNISVEAPQEIARAYGDNVVAELATSNQPVTVSSQFHKLPAEDLNTLLGLESTESGLSAYGGTDNPPYVACVFAKTHEDGSKEWVGLTKGKFMKPSQESNTKEDSVEFGNDTIEAEFIDRDVAGFTDAKSVIFGRDESGSTSVRDELFQSVFGAAHPDGSATP